VPGGLPEIGRTLVVLGAVVAAIGLFFVLVGRLPWLGRLPGDVVVRRGGFTLYLPIATSLLLSIVLTLVLWLLRR
jgi:Protein of unknown function (DUF2905)